ncbi:MAG: biopolymer transporter ExbD [Gammaproteobacteria bacterium]
MKESHRTRRMERHHKRNKKTATLNMVSMMDIFTILVFFLLVSAGNQQNLPDLKHIKLPESHAQQPPQENLLILVNKDNILFQGKVVASTKLGKRSSEKTVKKRGVTIMGDKKIPYALLKRIMLTCASSDFTNISLAVVHKAQEKN